MPILFAGTDAVIAEPVAPWPAPLRQLGDYELLEEIARGGMGILYRARQLSLNREVAVKLMRDSALARPEDVKLFRVEAAAAARLSIPTSSAFTKSVTTTASIISRWI